MSPIPSTDDDEAEYGLVFLLKWTEDGPTIDRHYDVSPLVGANGVAAKAAAKLTGHPTPEQRACEMQVRGMAIRVRMDGHVHGPYCVRGALPLPADVVQNMLRAMGREECKNFLRGAKL
jgi:hypothetical protein